MTDQAGSEAWSYDLMGRTAADQRTTAGVALTMTYMYNLDSSLATLTEPNTHVITYTTGGAGRTLTAKDAPDSLYYAAGAHYAPQGALANVGLGGTSSTPWVNSTTLFNKRLQPCWMYSSTSRTLPWNSQSFICTTTVPTGNVLDMKYTFNLGTADNGNVIGITNDRVPDRSQNFTYDPLNRIATAETTSTASTDATNCWGEQYAYDIWANLASISSASSSYTGCSQETGFGYTMTTKNQISTFCYDAAGNLLLQATCPTSPPYNYTYAYDAENHLSSTNGYTYLYDGDGRRVEKQTGNPLVPYKLYYYGEDGQVLAETNGSGTVTDEYVYFDGSRIAHRDSGLLYLYADDHLGSARAVIQSGSTSLTYDADFYPFGGERPVIIATDNNYKFTGKERDFESGLDDFGARYYSSPLGRFVSTDWSAGPEPVPYANLTNPQTLNLYALVNDNPETFADLDGHCPVCEVVAEEVTELAESPEGQEIMGEVGTFAQEAAAPLEQAAEVQAESAEALWGTIKGAGVAVITYISSPKSGHPPAVPAPKPAPKPAQPTINGEEDHKSNASPSKLPKHEEGKARKKRDKGGEKGDETREKKGMYPRKRPDGYPKHGSWPPKPAKPPDPPPPPPKKDPGTT